MDRQQSDAAEHEQRCQQFPVPNNSLHNDGLNLPFFHSSLWSYSPSLSYQQVHRSVWHPAEGGHPHPVVDRDIFSPSDCQHGETNEASLYGDISHLSRWQQADSTAAFVGGDTPVPFRTANNFDIVCDTLQSIDMSRKLNSSPAKHTHRCTSPRSAVGTRPDDFAASSDAELRLKFYDADTVPVHCQTTNCYECNSASSHDCDELNAVSVNELTSAGNTMPCSCTSETFSVACKLHSVHRVSSYLAQESTTECCDASDNSAARLHRHFHPTHRPRMFTDFQKTGFEPYFVDGQQHQSPPCAGLSGLMNELDDIELPPCNASTVNTVPTEMVGNAVSAAGSSCSPYDTGHVASTLSDSWITEQRKDNVDGLESRCKVDVKMEEKRSELNVQNCAECDSSISLSSVCPKMSSSNKKSRKKVQRSTDEKSASAVSVKPVCDNHHNLAAFDGAVETDSCARASEPADRTARVSAESDLDHRAAKSRNGTKSVHTGNGKSKSECLNTARSTAVEHSVPDDTDSVDTDKLSDAAVTSCRAESPVRQETTTGLRHHRRSQHKASRGAQKQKSTRHGSHEPDRTPPRFRLKRFLESVDWKRQRQKFELAAFELLAIVWNALKIIIGVIVYELVLTVQSVYRSVTDVLSAVLSWLAEKYLSWKLRRQRSNSTPTLPELSENITLPSTGEEAVGRLFACEGKDPYSILGLRKDCSDEDIRKYYRRQAVLVHPDKNSELGAEEAFKILNRAFEMIGEPEKRRQYDMATAKELADDVMMQEFTDLLTKLHETIKETINLMACSHCGGKHRRYPVGDVTLSAARYCARCDVRHPVKEGDVWAESSVFGFRWCYYACMDGDVYNITEWASCQREEFKLVRANSHFVMVHISTGSTGNKTHHRPSPSEGDLEELFNSMFAGMSAAAAADGRNPDSFPSTFFPSQGASSTASKTQSSAAKKKRKKRR